MGSKSVRVKGVLGMNPSFFCFDWETVGKFTRKSFHATIAGTKTPLWNAELNYPKTETAKLENWFKL